MQNQNNENDEVIRRLNKDLKKLTETMTVDEARFLVDSYYQEQENRLRADGQIRSMSKDKEPHEVLTWVSENTSKLETQIALALKCYAESQFMGRWALAVTGIGPIMAAGLLAHIELEPWTCVQGNGDKCSRREPHDSQCGCKAIQTVGHIWNFAGLNPEIKWGKKQKRPWNAALKCLCWKIGESFIKVSNNPASLYGRLFKERKTKYIAANEAGQYANRIAKIIEEKNFGRDTQAIKWMQGYYKPLHKPAGQTAKDNQVAASGRLYELVGENLGTPMLPPGHINAMARRWVVKLFLSHWFETAYRNRWGKEPPKCYAISILHHANYIAPEVGQEAGV